MRLLHFSDIHCGNLPQPGERRFDKRWLGAANQLLRRRFRQDWSWLDKLAARIRTWQPDLVVCTGDLTSAGLPSEFQLACDRLKPVLDACSQHFLYLPGNHDCYTGDPDSRLALAQTCRCLNRGTLELPDFPCLRQFGNLEILCLNQGSPQSWLSSCGQMPQQAWDRLHQLLQTPRIPGTIRIGAGHFPFRRQDGSPLGWRREFHGWSQLLAALPQAACQLWLCGHIHRGFFRQEPEGIQVLCAGSLTLHHHWFEIEIDNCGNCRTTLTQET